MSKFNKKENVTMSKQNNQNQEVQEIQPNIEEIIQDLTQQISQLTYDNAVLKSLVNQYQQREQANNQQEK